LNSTTTTTTLLPPPAAAAAAAAVVVVVVVVVVIPHGTSLYSRAFQYWQAGIYRNVSIKFMTFIIT